MAEGANPVGGATSPLSLREAADRIKVLTQDKSQANQPDPTAKEANSQTEPEATPKEAAKEPAPEPRAEPKPKPRAEGEDVEAEKSETTEPEPSEVELADSIEGLAGQLGVTVDQLVEHIHDTVKIDGQEKRVNLKELKAGFQFESHSRKTTMETADVRRKADEDIKAVAVERQQYAQYLVPLIQNLQASFQDDERALQALLESGDTGEFQKLQFKIGQKQQAFQALQREQQAMAQRQQQEFLDLQKQAMAESQRKLLTVFPEWKGSDGNPSAKANEEIRSLRAYAKERGVNPRAADTFFEAPFFEILHDAREYRKQQAAKPAALRKVVNVPKFQGAGSAKPSVKPEVAKLRVATDRLRKTGHVRDGAAALKIALRQRGIL